MATKKRTAAKVARAQRALSDREAIRTLRKHFTGYDKQHGYSLDPREIEQMPAHRRRALRKKHQLVATLLATPHVELKARTPAQAKVLRRETRQRFKGMKHFIVHVPDADRSTAQVTKAGRLSIRTKLPGRVEFDEQLFRWPRRPKSPDDMVAMLEKMDLPKTGSFVLQTSRYGDIGEESVGKRALIGRLRDYLHAYDKVKYGAHRFLNQVIGFRWIRSKLAGEVIRQDRSKAREAQREANREKRDRLHREARRAAKKT